MINWECIDTVLLDMDGTLLDLHYDNHFWLTHLPQRYATMKALDLESAKKELYDHIDAIQGTLDWYCLDYWSKSLGLNIAALKKETKDKIKERPYVSEFLSGLKNNNKTLYLVTNSHPVGIDIKLEQTSIGDFFDKIISSHQYQQPKETIDFWQRFHQDIHFNPERTLFIDDNLSVLNAAVDFGIKHILGIHQPDSQIGRKLTEVPAIYHFDEILPGLENG
ncbi:MAG: GMP/IMP nucleotidase [Pseudomonadota bacterium]